MKFQAVLVTTFTTLASISILSAAKADTVTARCDIYPIGEDNASDSVPCTFSQHQGYVYIDRQDGISYELSPVGSEPGNYIDQGGNAAYRQAGLGEVGQIYQFTDESVYVYWDASTGSSTPSSSRNMEP